MSGSINSGVEGKTTEFKESNGDITKESGISESIKFLFKERLLKSSCDNETSAGSTNETVLFAACKASLTSCFAILSKLPFDCSSFHF